MPLSCFDGNKIIDDDNSQEIFDLESILLGYEMHVKPKDELYTVADIYSSEKKKKTIELLLLCQDSTEESIAEILTIPVYAVSLYSKYFFRVKHEFKGRVDYLSYCDEQVSKYGEEDSHPLHVVWAVSLGSEFVCWRLNLKTTTYETGDMYEEITKEAYFYHREKSMGATGISSSEYTRSAKSVLSALKDSLVINKTEDNNAFFDIEKELDIIIEAREPTTVSAQEASTDGNQFIVNH